ncbi:hypothetical protein RHGRI_004544 [Rhododendron griersonianum]|uniref:Serine aminopeptidase S33 domain-containing protein n=1 Tax=Rhododendron griersonianum TaxID=479676 RepID=A0AAV6LBF3_9ERIC|nr:hypothetical protein RHGRI_004544 [Rhododendron griersonianum]
MEKEEELEQNRHNYWGNTPEEEYYSTQGIKSTKSFFTSPRGLTLFTRSWQPLTAAPRAAVCMVHGYGTDISWNFQSTPIFLAQNGFSCFALDMQGHGLSQGLRAFVPSVDDVVEDCVSFFDSVVKSDAELGRVPRFLFGESMGGAICTLIHLRNLEGFDGAILIAPMCKISDNVKPRWPLPEILSFFARLAPTLPIVPTADLLEKSVKSPEKKAIARMNPMRYNGKPRLGTVRELLRVTDYVSSRLRDVRIPFILLHGSADVVTDPDVSRELYDKAQSEDKTIKIYDGMMHSLLFGETEGNVEIVRSDILSWLNDRC